MAVFLCSQANALSCGPRTAVLAALSNLGETVAEQGVDQSGVWVAVTVDPSTLQWSFVMTPKGSPHFLCIVGTGSEWLQAPNASNGILYDGSLISISWNESGDWQLLYMESGLAEPPQVATNGSGWERLGQQI
jgi:hypothetical protein